MKIYEPSCYPDLLDNIKIDHLKIEEIIRAYKLSFLKVHNNNIEWFTKLPMFVDTFYPFIIEHNTIPSQDHFFEVYIEKNRQSISNILIDNNLLVGLKARIFRTYPSLVRDVHFAKFLISKLKNSSLIYNTQLDIQEGIDLMLTFKDKYYGINLFTNTSRAYTGREKKQFRHTPFSNVTYIDIPVDFKGSVVLGDFFLYGPSEFQTIKNIMITKI